MSTVFPYFPNDEITYVGYGVTGDGSSHEDSSGIRRTVNVPYLSYDANFVYTYDGVGDKNICSGDSGGGALHKNSDGDWTIVGVNSFGFDRNGGQPHCSGAGAAAGATRVDRNLGWISNYIDLDDVGIDEDDIDDDGNNGNGNGNGNNGGGSEPSSEPSDDWDPPFPDDLYSEETEPVKAQSCAATAGGSGLLSVLIAAFAGVFRRRREI
jgi:uncharacterized protein (TIGR03382 family)